MENKFIPAFKEALEMEEDTQVNLGDQFRDYDEWDSLARLSLIAMLDEEFSVEIEDDDFENIQTVEDLMNEVKKRQK